MARLIARPKIDTKVRGKGPRLLREWRTAQDPPLSLAEVGEALGYAGHRSVQGYETGRQRLPVDKLVVLARIMGVEAEQLAAPDQVSELRRLLGATVKAVKEAR